MISYFPEIYPDELVYSVLSRLYVHSGYTSYAYASEDFFLSKSENPSIEFINQYSKDIFNHFSKAMPFKALILKHTMFPYYARFMPAERKKKAMSEFINMNGRCYDLLSIPHNADGQQRYLRYCPLCTKSDREKYSETYWHRIHQMQGVNVCPEHNCRLCNSAVPINRKASPMLYAAEFEVDSNAEIIFCNNLRESQLVKYVADVFTSELNADTPIGLYLHSQLEGTAYISPRGQQRKMKQLTDDFLSFYCDFSDGTMQELWQIQKIFTGSKWNCYEVCQLAFFLNISPDDLCKMELPEKSQAEKFDSEVIRLRDSGIKYPEIAKRLNAPLDTVKIIGEKGHYTPKKQKSNPQKGGHKRKDWYKFDADMLPLVIEAINDLQKSERPVRITRNAVEKTLNLKPKQLDNMPLCNAEIMRHAETQQQYWAREILWAYHTIQETGQPTNWKHIRNLTNIRKDNMMECLPYIEFSIACEIKHLI